MSARRLGRPLAAVLVLTVPAASPAGTLSVETAAGAILQLDIAEGEGWCLRWNHSVTGGAVADCFANRGGRMVLDRSYLHDTAAGLGEVSGRGRMRPADKGGYWIEAIDEPIPGNALPLRVGRPSTGHRITHGGAEYGISDRAAGQRVTLRLEP